MNSHKLNRLVSGPTIFVISALLLGCGAQPGVTNVNISNAGSNTAAISNSANANANVETSGSTSTVVVETKEPEQYEAKVTLKLETLGGQQNVALPTMTATVARGGSDRRMEFAMPAGGRVVYLDKAGTNYLILPEKKQYAELNRDSLGFDVRRLMMPEQIVSQVKNVRGMERVGEEQYNGREAIKYKYAAVADTQSKAGQVETESFLLVDKATGLPLRSETVSQSQGNVKGYNGLRIITEISDIKTEATPDLFAVPTGLQKIESDQVRSQVNLIFNSVAMLISQMMNQGQPAASPAASPAR
ncbi:MAG: hypothetical protein ABIV48_08990 [Pyrinomonadaceae bacterium]